MWGGMYVTSAKNGNIYFGVEFPPPAHFVMTKFADTGYVSLTSQEIKFADSHPEGKSIFHPAIAPDESFIIFDNNKELFVSFRESDESWGIAISLSNVLKEQTGTIPSVSPDGKYLFYGFHNDLYWVDTKILGIIRPEE